MGKQRPAASALHKAKAAFDKATAKPKADYHKAVAVFKKATAKPKRAVDKTVTVFEKATADVADFGCARAWYCSRLREIYDP